MKTSKFETVLCPCCSQYIYLQKSGKMWAHGPQQWLTRDRSECPGSRLTVAEAKAKVEDWRALQRFG